MVAGGAEAPRRERPEGHFIEGAACAFDNDTNAARDDQKAADLAWNRAITFFREKLR